MAIKTFKEIIQNKGYRINTNDRKIFEEGTLESFFGFGEKDAIEFIVYDINDNQLPQINDELVRYIPLNSENIREYFLIPEGTLFKKYQFPTEYFIDAERLLREAGYDNGIFKTQVTLINKRVGSNSVYDKLWISEISPSRTEIRLFPLKRGLEINSELQKRYDLFVKNGQFRDDTIQLAFNFIEKITPTVIDTFLQTKYTEKWYNKLVGEFKIQDFDLFTLRVYEKFIEAAVFHFTNRVSNPTNINYGKPKNSKPDIELSVEQIKNICKTIIINCIDFYLSSPDVKKQTTFDEKTNESIDVTEKVLQRLENDVIVDTRIPEVKVATLTKKITTKQTIIKNKIDEQLPIEQPPPKVIPPKQLPVEPPVLDIPIRIEVPVKETPIVKEEPTPVFGGGGGGPRGGGGGGTVIRDFGTGNGREIVIDSNDERRENLK